MTDRVYNVLFLCTGNSARSIIAECVLNRLGKGRFNAYSIGSFPKGKLHPYALSLLTRQDYSTADLRSKSWDEFARPGAPQMDFVFTPFATRRQMKSARSAEDGTLGHS